MGDIDQRFPFGKGIKTPEHILSARGSKALEGSSMMEYFSVMSKCSGYCQLLKLAAGKYYPIFIEFLCNNIMNG